MLPIALRPNGRHAVLIGGGAVALRKVETLLAAQIAVHVVAPRIDPRLRDAIVRAGGILHEREYARGDLADALLAIAATDDDTVNVRVVADAREQCILVCDATQSERGNVTMLATVQVGELTFAIDSGASSPAFAKRLAREVRAHFGPEYDLAARTLARMRVYVKAVLPNSERGAVLRELAELPIAELAQMNPVVAEHVVEATIERQRGARATPIPTQATSHFIAASRASALAMTQTKHVVARLAEHGIASTILSVTTSGDRIVDRPLAELGSRNVFVTELELALRERRADYAVHSCKDLPGELAADMRIAAFSAREDPRDAFCSERYESIDALPPGAVVGTSSPRRRGQLEALRPDLKYEDIRGNVDTRLRKLRDGNFDAIVLAMAGLRRLHLAAKHTVAFPIDVMVPAVAQGVLAVETRLDDDELAERVYAAINERASALCVCCERAALRQLHAGCDAPVGIYARIEDHALFVEAAYALAGSAVLRERADAPVRSVHDAEALGEIIGQRLLAQLSHIEFRTSLPLKNRMIVLGRTQDRPSAIAAALRGRGAEVVEVAHGETGPNPHEHPPDLLLFPSSGSVAAMGSYLNALRAQRMRPAVIVMGPQSALAARGAGFEPSVVAAQPSIESILATILEHFGSA